MIFASKLVSESFTPSLPRPTILRLFSRSPIDPFDMNAMVRDWGNERFLVSEDTGLSYMIVCHDRRNRCCSGDAVYFGDGMALLL